MSESKTNAYRVKLDVLPRTVAATDKPARRFQAHLKLRGKLTGKELVRRLAEWHDLAKHSHASFAKFCVCEASALQACKQRVK